MTIDDNNDNNNVNTNLETGQPVTRDDALDFERQMRSEARLRYYEQNDKKSLSNTDVGASNKQQLVRLVEEALQRQVDAQRNGPGTKASWFKRREKGDGIEKVDLFYLADMTLSSIMDNVEEGVTERTLHERLGRDYKNILFFATMSQGRIGRRMLKRLDRQVTTQTSDGEYRRKIIERKAASWGYSNDDWTPNECAKIGSVLLGAVMEATNLVEVRPDKRSGDKHLKNYVFFTATAEELLREHHELFASLSSYWRPMIYPPNGWSRENLGPYLAPELSWMIPEVRNASPSQKAAIQKGMANGELHPLFEALNFIQAVPYTINTYVADAVEWVHEQMREEGDFAQQLEADNIKLKKFPSLAKIKDELRPDRLKREDFDALPKEKQIELAQEHQEIDQDDAEVVQNKSVMARRLQTARMMRNFARFWLPHNFDYRGRVYHIPDFGHHNADWTRGLFLFANKKPIGDAVNYLKLQLANTFGKDKLSLDERVEWVDENIHAIYETGREFEGSWRFWVKAKEPFQFLAACREWFNYKNEGPTYKSGLPVGLDATQSGVQHYAAASLNPKDGRLVNLTDNERPSDFYQACLDAAKRRISESLQDNLAKIESDPWTDEERQIAADHDALMSKRRPKDFEAARLLEEEKHTAQTAFKETTAYRKQMRDKDILAAQNVIALGDEYDRGVIKRNAMTYGYSSRRFGFAEQLRKDWMSDFSKDVRRQRRKEHPFGADKGFHAGWFLANIHEAAIEEVVSSVKDGMKFLRDIAEILADDDAEKIKGKPKGKHFRFTNRMGFPFEQFYRHHTSKKQKVFGFDRPTMKWDKKAQSYFRLHTDRVDKEKAMDGVSPNVIHCQDSCHLLMTTLACKDEGLTDIMVVHDSFATTIADTEKLSLATRKQFIDLYHDYCLYEDILEQAKQVHSDPGNVDWPTIPSKGDKGMFLDLGEVMASDYFFN